FTWKRPPTISPHAYRPGIGSHRVSRTWARALTLTPPKVKVIPPVTGYATNGGVSSGCAQFDFGSSRPRVASPSWTLGSKWPLSTAALYSSSVLRHASRSEERRVGKECRSRWSPYD